MNEPMGMFSAAELYLRIIPSPLVAAIKGGEYVTRQWSNSSQLLIDGSISYDPDVDPNNQTGLEYIWLCRRSCEYWPTFDADYNIIGNMSNNTCVYDDKNDRGCSKIDGLDSAGKISNAKTGSVLKLNLGELHEDNSIVIRLVVRSNGKEGFAEQEIFFTQDSTLALSLR